MEQQGLHIACEVALLHGGLNEEEIAIMASIMEVRELNRKDAIVQLGQRCRCMVYVYKGLLRQFYFKNGREITEHFTCEGNIAYCIESLFGNKPSALMMETLENSVVALIPYAQMVELGKIHLGLSDWLRSFMEKNLILHQIKADSWRFETIQERYERFLREFPTIAHRASVNDIASYLLMTPESLSRVRSQALKKPKSS